MHDTVTDSYYNGGARPFKYKDSLDKLDNIDFLVSPYTKKQLKSFEYISKKQKLFEDIFEKADVITPEANYASAIKLTFGVTSKVYKLYSEKATEPVLGKFQPTLYIDFEAINMRICGWYAELVLENETIVYEGIAKPFSDNRYIKKIWDKVYADLLPYSVEDILKAKHINHFERYFVEMFSKARKIITYGDTDAYFVQNTFGEDLYNFFKIKNLDASLRLENRTISLDKCCKLCNVEVDGAEHDPKYDVIKMRKCLDYINNL